MPKIEVDSTELERVEYFYLSPLDLEQIVADAIRYRFVRSRMGLGGCMSEELTINKEHDAT